MSLTPQAGRCEVSVGELVIRQPLPGMTRGFWNDPDRYLEAYWSRFPGVWVHGDWALVDEAGYWYIQGRSDDTLKVAGKRVGPAEVESAAVAHPAVVEAAAIGIPHAIKGESIAVFCVLAVRGPRHAPRCAGRSRQRSFDRSGRPSSRMSCSLSGRCPRPGPARSCGA